MRVFGDRVGVTQAGGLKYHQRRAQQPKVEAVSRGLGQSSNCQHRERGFKTEMLYYNKFKMHKMTLSNYSFFLSWRREEDEVP